MYKLSLKIALILPCSNSYANNFDNYAEALDWQEKWEKVISRTTGNYVDKHFLDKLSQLPKSKQTLIANKLKNAVSYTHLTLPTIYSV